MGIGRLDGPEGGARATYGREGHICGFTTLSSHPSHFTTLCHHGSVKSFERMTISLHPLQNFSYIVYSVQAIQFSVTRWISSEAGAVPTKKT